MRNDKSTVKSDIPIAKRNNFGLSEAIAINSPQRISAAVNKTTATRPNKKVIKFG